MRTKMITLCVNGRDHRFEAPVNRTLLQALRDDKRGRKRTKHPLEDENERLRKRNARLAARLEQAEAIIEI